MDSQLSEPSQQAERREIWVRNRFKTIGTGDSRKRKCMGIECSKSYAYKTSFDHLRDHWTKHHVDIRVLPPDNKPLHPKPWIHALIAWIVKRKHPFSEVEDPYFRNFCASMDRSKPIFGRHELSCQLNRLATDLEPVILEKLITASSIALTFDIWTAKNSTRSFLTITAHYVTNTWQLDECILEFTRLKFPHDCLSISKALIDTIEKYKIANKIIALTADNVKVNDNAIAYVINELKLQENFGFEDLHMRCVAHILNLAVQDGLKELRDDLNDVRYIVDKIRGSTKQTEEFESIQKQLIDDWRAQVSQDDENMLNPQMPTITRPKALKVYRLVAEVKTRWNSTFDMLHRFVTLEKAVEEALKRMALFKKTPIHIDWMKLKKVVRYLKPFYDLTVMLSANRYATVPLICTLLPLLINELKDYLSDVILGDSAKAIYEKLMKYGDVLKSDLAKISTILDPRVKLDFISYDFRDEYEQKLRQYATKVAQDPFNDSTEEIRSQQQSIFDRAYQDEERDEVSRYLNSARALKNSDVLAFWKSSKENFPVLRKLAKVIHCVQATSVESERMFSLAGQYDEPHRGSLADESFRSSMLLNSWLTIVKDD